MRSVGTRCSMRVRVVGSTRMAPSCRLTSSAKWARLAGMVWTPWEASISTSSAYHGLADLFLGWAKRIDSPEEEVEYLAKAEETISRGLREVRNKASLWIVSADIQSWLGDAPAALGALKKAVEATPGSIT